MNNWWSFYFFFFIQSISGRHTSVKVVEQISTPTKAGAFPESSSSFFLHGWLRKQMLELRHGDKQRWTKEVKTNSRKGSFEYAGVFTFKQAISSPSSYKTSVCLIIHSAPCEQISRAAWRHAYLANQKHSMLESSDAWRGCSRGAVFCQPDLKKRSAFSSLTHFLSYGVLFTSHLISLLLRSYFRLQWNKHHSATWALFVLSHLTTISLNLLYPSTFSFTLQTFPSFFHSSIPFFPRFSFSSETLTS